ncbi:MAG: hypothetical protein PHS95_01535 [Candidatus Pacebacteria bacterium]|nr:hypothetical protein [Candidatus Paceibacterota bacterium]
MKKGLLIIVSVAFLLLVSQFRASVPSARAEGGCPEVFTGLSKTELENALAECTKEEEALKKAEESTLNVKTTVSKELTSLKARIKKAEDSIKLRTAVINNLGQDITLKSQTINNYQAKIDRERDSLAQLIRKTNEIDSYSLTEVMLSDKKISDFFADLDSFDYLNQSIKDSLVKIDTAKKITEEQKTALEDKQAETIALRKIQELEKKNVTISQTQKQHLLTLTNKTLAEQQEDLKKNQQAAAAIRSELFRLNGTKSIPFGTALAYANEASAKTGVRPAVILGILTIESNLGENQGTGTWQADMHPKRDIPIFKDITSRLGLDPDKMPVSARPCSKAERDRVGPGVSCGYGWGGAMGPSQFIPSTWILYEKRIAAMSGSNPPNPWNARDAIFATALLMKDNGADAGTRASERLAALRYLAGWANANKPSLAFYGSQTMEYADKYQKDIDTIGGNLANATSVQSQL